MSSYTRENLLPGLIAEGVTLNETRKQFETALSILRNEEKVLMESLVRLKHDEQLQESRSRHRNRSRIGFNNRTSSTVRPNNSSSTNTIVNNNK